MISLGCRLFGHKFNYVGNRQRKPTPWTTIGWNSECVRCGKTAYITGAA
jgi:hypothetical protein